MKQTLACRVITFDTKWRGGYVVVEVLHLSNKAFNIAVLH